MSLLISYQDSTEKIVYANLFSATDKTKGFNTNSSMFSSFSLESQSDFAIILSEDSVRKGYYSHIITETSSIPPTEDGDFYLVEVFESLGSGYDRESDPLLGTMAFYWNGEREVDICGCQTQAGTSLTAEDIWSYQNRSLTSEVDCGNSGNQPVEINLECPDPYITVNATIEGLDEVNSKLDNNASQLNEVIRLINNLSVINRPIPRTSVPNVGPRGSSGGTSNIRIR